MLYRRLEDHQVTLPLNHYYGAKNPLTKGFCPVGTISQPDKHHTTTQWHQNSDAISDAMGQW